MTRSLFALALTLFLSPLLLTGLMQAPPRLGEVAADVIPPPAEDDGKVVAGDDSLVEKANKAIAAAIDFLKEQQSKKTGGWDPVLARHANDGGWTALALLALLNAGEPADSPVIKAGLDYLRKVDTRRTYVIALRLMVFCHAARKDQERIRADVKYLEDALLPDGWTYHQIPAALTGNADNSNTQYALLGLHEATMAGVPVKKTTLETVRKLYLDSQVPDGGWSYKPATRARGTATMTMTAAGVCNLLIAGEDLARGKAVLRADGSAENCGKYVENEAVNRGLRWIGDKFPARLDATNVVPRLGSPFYCLYGLERTGRLSGQRFFGNHDWYEVGTRYLVGSQRENGSWAGTARAGTLDHEPIVATSFALLFLSKGRVPVLVSKLAYGDGESTGWNNKRSDVKHLVEFCSKSLFDGKPLAWQAFDIRNAGAAGDAEAQQRWAAQLLQSPVVYFNGHTMAPRGAEAAVLKEYVNNGGFVLVENCCGRERFPKFDADLKRLVRDLFADAKLEKLEPDHPIFLASGKYASSPKDFPLEGVKQGCKTVLVYSPVPISGYWESNDQKPASASLKAFEMGANIVAYASGLEAPRPRGWQVTLTADRPKEPVKRGYLQVAQMRHDGEWQPAPRAMRNLMVEARKTGLDVMLKTEALFPSDEGVLDHRFLYMHGRGHFAAKREDLKHLRFNLRSGGLLLADACCGATKFDAAFRKFVDELFGDEKLTLVPVPADDPLYGEALNGKAIKTVRRRVQKADGTRKMEEVPPALEGVKYRGRWVILYSKWDIGCALETKTGPECLGHDQKSALDLGRAAVLYALTR